MEHPPIEVRLLGSFEVWSAGAPVHVPRGRPRALLVTLALSAGRVVSVDVLAERVWGDEPPRNARNALQNNVRRLRRLLGAEAIVTAVDGYLLAVPPDNVDALRFLALVERANHVEEQASRAEELRSATAEPAHGADRTAGVRELLVEALSLWQGEPLTGVGHGPLERDQAAALTERYLAALERRIDLDMARGRYVELVAELRELTARHLLRESLWGKLLVALHRLGRRAEALDTYERIRRHLADQLGADPSPELRGTYHQLLVEDTAPDPPNADPVAAGAAVSGVAAPRRPAEAARVVPRQLPPTIPVLVGRERELSELDRLLDGGPPVSICAIHGAGGMGKSALATHWAHRARSRFPDGQLFVNLRGYGPEAVLSPAAALGSLLRAVGLSPGAIPTDLAAASALLRTTLAGRRMLLLLDNARDPEQVRPLLPGGGNLVLVTSRHQMTGLGVRDGAHRIALHEIAAPDALVLLAASIGAERVAAEPEPARELVDRCARLPLALRIAAELASRFPGTSLADLVAELGDRHDDAAALAASTGLDGRLDALADDEDAAADVRAVFSWSYLALGPETARAFRLLGHTPGTDLSLAAAAALLGVPVADARTVLDRLAAVHLVEQRRRGHYQMHDLLRAYAAERAAVESPAERDRAEVRLLDWYLHTLHSARVALRFSDGTNVPDPPADPAVRPLELDAAEVARWYESERPALLAAVRLATVRGHWRHGWQLAARQRDFCELRSELDDWVTVAELGYRCARQVDSPLARYLTAGALGSGYSNVGRYAEATPLLEEALQCARQLGDPVKVAGSLSRLGTSLARAGEYRAALRYHGQAVRTARESGHRYQLAHALLNLGAYALDTDRPDGAVAPTSEALALYEQLDAGLPQALALANLADAYHIQRRYEQASRYAERALERFAAGGWSPTLDTLLTVGRIRAALGEVDAAREVCGEAIAAMGHEAHAHPRMAEFAALLAELDQPAGLSGRGGPTAPGPG